MQDGIDRRVTLGLLGGASLSLLGANATHAQQTPHMGYAVQQLAEGVEQRLIGEGHSMIPGYAKVRVREITYQPGARSKGTMANPMICQTASGTLHSVLDGQAMENKAGMVWSCNKGTVEETTNRGSEPAVMRVADLLPA